MLRYARSFCILAEELHFSRAAARLNMTQPALSHQIKALEQEIGCSLLHRSPHSVSLTDAGAVLARELRVVLAQVGRAVQETLDVARGDAGALAIGYCELPMAGGLARIMQQYAALYPRVEVTLHTLPTNQQAAALRSGSIDIGFLHPEIDADFLVVRPAGDERMVAALPPTHPLAARNQLMLSDLAGEKLIFCTETSAPHMHHAVLSACGRAGFTPRQRPAEESWHAMACLAAAGQGVALVPESLGVGLAQVVLRPIADLDLRLQTAIATAGVPVRPAVLRFLDLCPNATA
jgi:DNA-binding transcriptional LysR family regulator